MTWGVNAVWDHADIGSLTIKVTDLAGPITITVSTGTHCNTDLSGYTNLTGLDVTGYTDFATAFAAKLNASALNAAGNYSCSWSATTGKYTIQCSSETFSVSQANAVGANILGFSDPQDATGSSPWVLTATNKSYYSIASSVGAISDWKHDYEPAMIADDSEADDGTPSGQALTTPAVYSDWTVQAETRAKTIALAAVATTPWTWQHFVRYVRNTIPFECASDGADGSRVHMLRADGASWSPQPMVASLHTHFNIPFRTRVIADLS